MSKINIANSVPPYLGILLHAWVADLVNPEIQLDLRHKITRYVRPPMVGVRMITFSPAMSTTFRTSSSKFSVVLHLAVVAPGEEWPGHLNR